MKTLKIADILISLGLIIFYCISYKDNDPLETLIEAYLVVGGWQCISMLWHALNSWHTRKCSTRYIYHWISFISVITMPIGSIWILTFAAPFMALFYIGMCFSEVVKNSKEHKILSETISTKL